MSTSNTSFRFDVDGEPLALALKRTQTNLKELAKEYVNLGRNTKITTEQMVAEQTRIIQQFVKEEQALDHLQNKRKQAAIEVNASNATVTRSTAAAAGSMGKYGMMIGQVSFAVDDFVTVAQMQKWSLDGVIAGLRSAANNFGMVLYAIHPLLAIVPSLATAIGGPLLKSMFGTGQSAKELADQTERANKAIEELSKRVIELQKGSQAVKDIEDNAKLDVAIHEQSMRVGTAHAAVRDFKPTFEERKPWFGEWENSVFEEDERQRLVLEGTLKKEEDKLEKLKKDKEAVIRDRNRTREAEEAVNQQRPQLEAAAGAMAAQGMNPEDVFMALQGNADLPYTSQTQSHLRNIANQAVQQHQLHYQNPQTEEEGLIKLKMKKKDELQDEKSALQQEKIDAQLGSPNGKLTKKQDQEFERRDREFAKRESELNQEIRELRRKQEERDKEMLDETKKTNYYLELLYNNSNKRPAPGANANVLPPG